MVTETGESADIGAEFRKVDAAAQALYGLVKVPIDAAVRDEAMAQLEVLTSEVNLTDHDAAVSLEGDISAYFQDRLDLPLDLKVDLKRDPAKRFSDREEVRGKIDQLAALALKYSEFEHETNETQEADKSTDVAA